MAKKPTPDHIIERNRQNAKHSTGPKTAFGKSRSCRNALKHGFTSKWVHNAEDAREMHRLNRELTEEYRPVGTLEADLLNTLALSQHRWERLQSEVSDLERLATYNVAGKEHSIDTKLAVVRHEAPAQLATLDTRQRYLRQTTNDLVRWAERFQLLQLRRKKEEREAEKWQIEKTKREKAAQPDIWATPYHSQSRTALEMRGIDAEMTRHFLHEQLQLIRQREKAAADEEKSIAARKQEIAAREIELGIKPPPAPEPPPPPPPPPTPEPPPADDPSKPAIDKIVITSSTRNEPRQIPPDHPIRQNPLLDDEPKA